MAIRSTLAFLGAFLSVFPASADPGLETAIHQALHRIERSGAAFTAYNPTQHLDVRFEAAGTEFVHRGHRFRVSMADQPASSGIAACDNRITLPHGNITEWYVNTKEGLEQGFTVAERQGPLELRLAVTGDYRPAMDELGVVLRAGDGSNTTLRYGGLTSWDATGRKLASHAEVVGNEIRLVVDDTAAQYPVTVDPIFQEPPMRPTDGVTGDKFGSSVAISGDRAVVGAPYKNGGTGAIYIFVRSNGAWVLDTTFTTSDERSTFGWSVAISGNTIVAGAPYAGPNFQGAAVVFTRTGAGWGPGVRVTRTNAAPSDLFGWSVAIEGDTLVVGAPSAPSGGAGVGASVFTRSGGTWSQQAQLTFQSEVTSMVNFGVSVSISGDTVVIGSLQGFVPGLSNSGGIVEVFLRSGTVWSRQAVLSAPENTANGGTWQFGASLSLSGDTLLVGSPGALVPAPHDTAYVFTRSGVQWNFQQKLTASDGFAGSLFGSSVALSGDVAVVGAPLAFSGRGSAYIYTRTGTSWAEKSLNFNVPSAAIGYGTAVAVEGNTLMVAAPTGNSNIGETYTFRLENVAVRSNPPGQTFILTGSGCGVPGTYTTPYTGFWGQCTVQWTTPGTGTGTRYNYQNWTDGNPTNPRTFTFARDPGSAEPFALTANFSTEYQLTTQSLPTSGGTVTGAGWYAAGASAGVAAIPNVGFTFTGFSGGLTGVVSPQNVLMDGPKTVTGGFTTTPPAVLSGLVTAKTGAANNRQWTIALTNNGPGVAYGAQLYVLMFVQTFGTPCTSLPVRLVPAILPASLGTLAPAGSAQIPVTLDFSGCPSTARFTVSLGYMSNGGASGGLIQLVNQFQ